MARIAVGGFHHETNCFVPGGHISDAREYPYRKLRSGIRLAPVGSDWRPNVPPSD